MLIKIKLLLLFILINFCNLSENYGQDTQSKFYFGGINFNTGKFLPHSKRIDKIKSGVFAVQAKIYQNINYSNDWKNPFNATKFGYSLTYIHANNAVIGDLWGVNMFMEPSLFSFHRLHFYTHMGAGIAYATTKYNKESNPTNFMISTDLSFFFNLKLNLDLELNKQFSLGLNAGFSHCSNAALNLPNLGINIFNYGFNLGYKIYDDKNAVTSSKLNTDDKKWAYDIAVGAATRGVNEEIDKYYFIVNSDFSINRFLSRKNIMSLNLHYVLRQGDIYDTYYDTKFYNYIGLALGHELLIRKLSVLTQLGAYLYDTNLNQHFWYAHLGIRYYFTKNIFGMITLANRKQSADYLQYAVGYRFK